MKKILTLFAALVLLAVGATAQKLSYSAVVRNSANELQANKTLTVTISIANSINGDVIYSETHNGVQTNQNGLLTLTIGDNPNYTGDISAVTWPTAFITTDITLPGGAHVLNTTPVTAVPYALYADHAGNGGGSYTVTPADILNAVSQMNTEQRSQLCGLLSCGSGEEVPPGFTVTNASVSSTNGLTCDLVLVDENLSHGQLSHVSLKIENTTINVPNQDIQRLRAINEAYRIRVPYELLTAAHINLVGERLTHMKVNFKYGEQEYSVETNTAVEADVVICPTLGQTWVPIAPADGDVVTFGTEVINSNENITGGFYTITYMSDGSEQTLTLQGDDVSFDEEGNMVGHIRISAARPLYNKTLTVVPTITLNSPCTNSEGVPYEYEMPTAFVNCPRMEDNITRFQVSNLHGVYTANVPFIGGSDNLTVSGTYAQTAYGVPGDPVELTSEQLYIQNHAIVLDANLQISLDFDQSIEFTVTLTDEDNSDCTPLTLTGLYEQFQLGCTNFSGVSVTKSGNDLLVTAPFELYSDLDQYNAAESYCVVYDKNASYADTYTALYTQTAVTITEDPTVENGYILSCTIPYTAELSNYARLRIRPFVKVWCSMDVNYTFAEGTDGYYPPFQCPSLETTTASFSDDGTLSLTTPYNNPDYPDVMASRGSYTLDAGDGHSAIISANRDNSQISLEVTANTQQMSELYGKALTVTPHLIFGGCGSSSADGEPVTVLPSVNCPTIGAISYTYDLPNDCLVFTATVSNPHHLTLGNLIGEVSYNNGSGPVSVPLTMTFSANKLTGAIRLGINNGRDIEGKQVIVKLAIEVSGCGIVYNTNNFSIPAYAHVGDILCTDGSTVAPNTFIESGKTALGVVFYVDSSNMHGWAAALRDLGDSARFEWASHPLDVYGIRNITNADAWEDFNGYDNTMAMLQYGDSLGFSPVRYIDIENGWYLPAAGQLHELRSVQYYDYGVGGLTPAWAVVGTALDNDYNYWSSTEYDRVSAWYAFANGYLHWDDKNSNYYKIRCVRNF